MIDGNPWSKFHLLPHAEGDGVGFFDSSVILFGLAAFFSDIGPDVPSVQREMSHLGSRERFVPLNNPLDSLVDIFSPQAKSARDRDSDAATTLERDQPRVYAHHHRDIQPGHRPHCSVRNVGDEFFHLGVQRRPFSALLSRSCL